MPFPALPAARPSRLATLASLVVSLAACGGGGSSAPPPPPQPPALASASPADGATGVASSAVLRLTFSVAIDPASAAQAVTLFGPIGPVAGAVAVSGSVVTFTPAQPLAWGTHYTLALDGSLKSAAGPTLGTLQRVAFTTGALTWKAASAVSPAGGSGSNQAVAFDAAGNALLLWMQATSTGTGFTSAVTASRWSAAAGQWSAPTSLQGTTADHTQSPIVALSPRGNAMVIWEQGPATPRWEPRLTYARYDAATGSWTQPAPVVPGAANAQYGAAVATAPNGDAVAAWIEVTGSTTTAVVAARFHAATGAWETPHTLSAPGGVTLPSVAMDGAGNGLVGFGEKPTGAAAAAARAARLAGATGVWSAPTSLQMSSDPGGSVLVALDGTGNATAVWVENFTSTPQRLMAATAAPGGAFAAPAQVVSVDVRAGQPGIDSPVLALDPGGSALLAWIQYGTAAADLMTSRRSGATGSWNPALSVATGFPQAPAISFDEAGNAVAVWWDMTTGQAIGGARYEASSGSWGAPAVLQTGTSNCQVPSMALSPAGIALAAWSQTFGADDPLEVAWLAP